MRAAVLHAGASCAYCFTAGGPGNPLVVDHVVPHSKGGSSDISNLQALCEACNRAKRDTVPGAGGLARVPYFASHHFPSGARA